MKNTIVLIISCLILSMNLSVAQKMTICDCITQYTLMAEDMNNGLSEEAAMKKYEKTDSAFICYDYFSSVFYWTS